MDLTGPEWTLLDVQRLVDGRVRVLVRKRGGRLIRLIVAAQAVNGFDITDLVDHIVRSWPAIPTRDY